MQTPFLKLTLNGSTKTVLINPAVIIKVVPVGTGSAIYLLGGAQGENIHVTASVEALAMVLDARDA
jgi:hypothetical protein